MGALRNQQEAADVSLPGSLQIVKWLASESCHFCRLLVRSDCAPGGLEGQGYPQLGFHWITILLLPLPSCSPRPGASTLWEQAPRCVRSHTTPRLLGWGGALQLGPVFLKREWADESTGRRINCRLWFSRSGVVAGFCVSHRKHPGDVLQGTHLSSRD